MKQQIVLVTAFAAITYLTLTANKSGSTTGGYGNKTGGPGSSGQTCAETGCHTSGIGTTTGGFEVRKKFQPDSNALVNSYLPDSLYSVLFSGTHTTLNKCGLQLSCLKFKDSTNAGIFSGLPAKIIAVNIGGKTLLESTDTLSKTGTNFEIRFTWKAPPKNSGQIRFYTMLLASNGDGTAAGDKASSTIMYPLAEAAVSIANTSTLAFNTYPNPTVNTLNIVSIPAENGTYNIDASDITGKKIMTRQVLVNDGILSVQVNTTAWNKGIYLLSVKLANQRKTVMLIKE